MSDNLVLQSEIGSQTVTKSIESGRRVTVQSMNYHHSIKGTLYGVTDTVFVLRKTIQGDLLRGIPVEAVKSVTLRRAAWQLISKILFVVDVAAFGLYLFILLLLVVGLYYPGLAAAVSLIMLAALVPLVITTFLSRRTLRIPPWRIMH